MDARQLKKLNMMLTVAHVCKENIAIVSMVAAMPQCLEKFDKLLQDVLNCVKEQDLPTKQHAAIKREARYALASHLGNLLPLASSYALLSDDLNLFTELNLTFSDLYRMRGIYLYCRAQVYHDILKNNSEAFKEVGIKKPDIDKLQQLIHKFQSLDITPAYALKLRIGATQRLEQKLSEADMLLKGSIDSLLNALTQYQSFHKIYFRARRQITYGRPKQVLKNKIKQYQSAPEIPRKYLRRASKFKPVPIIIPEKELVSVENPQS